MRNERLSLNVFYNDEDGYIADIPDLKFCSAFGETPEEASATCRSPRRTVEVAKERGNTIPKPRYRPAICQVAH
jgi:predicted RNase H-like HicB family nuclease